MDTRLLKKLRKEAFDTYIVEKRQAKYYVVFHDIQGTSVLSEHESLHLSKLKCDNLRESFIYNRMLSLKAAYRRYRRVY